MLHRLDAAPHESIWCLVSDAIKRPEVTTRVRFLRLKMVLQALDKWSLIEPLQRDPQVSTMSCVIAKLNEIVMDQKGIIQLLDLYYAAVKTIKIETRRVEWAAWIPVFPAHLVPHVSHTREFPMLDSCVLRKLKDQGTIMKRLEAAISLVEEAVAKDSCETLNDKEYPTVQEDESKSTSNWLNSGVSPERSPTPMSPPRFVHRRRARFRLSESPEDGGEAIDQLLETIRSLQDDS